MSKDALISGTSGMTATVLLTVNTSLITNMMEVFVVGVVGGAAGLVGKMLVQYLAKKINKNKQLEEDEKS
jgi:dolichol kinase